MRRGIVPAVHYSPAKPSASLGNGHWYLQDS
jgi:hypothetical protein